MARLIFEMSQSLDGFVDHDKMAPGPELFRHFTARVGSLSGAVYGRRVYQLMQYWDQDDANWSADERDFAQVMRRLPKWVASRSLTSVGQAAQLVSDGLADVVAKLKATLPGEIAVAGPRLAASLAAVGLVDEYRIYVRPYVLGQGAPFFAGHCPALTLLDCERIGEDAVQLRYAPQ